MSNSLRSKAIHALSWSFVESVGLQGVRFIIGIVLARILFPEQFGLIAMLTLFIAVGQAFLDSGFGAALIQKRDVTETEASTIFYFNIVVGIVASGILSLMAPLIAAFYSQPILTPITRALSLVIVINSFGLIQDVLLTKQLNVKTQTKVSLIAGVLSGIIGVILALTDFGVWSLVAQQISHSCFRTLLLWCFNDWRPSRTFSIKSLQGMFGFGSRLLASGLLDQLFNNIYFVVIGRLFSARDLGFFTRASGISSLPTHTLAAMIARVSFPVLSTIQDDRARMKRGLKQAVSTLALLNFPMMIGLAVLAYPVVIVLLTDKWSESVSYLQLLCVSGLLYPLHVINLDLLKALGRSDLFLRLEVIKKVLIVANIAATSRWGITVMIFGMIVTSLISYYLNAYYTAVLIGYSMWEQLRDMCPYLIMSIMMGMAVYAVGLLPFPNDWPMLLAQIALGIIVYIALCRTFRLKTFIEIWQWGLTLIRDSASRQDAKDAKPEARILGS